MQSIGMKPGNALNIVHDLAIARSEADDLRRLFLAYLHCLYEANKQDLLVEPHIFEPSTIVKFEYKIALIVFDMYKLSVHDLNVIFFFILDLGIIYYPYVVNFTFEKCSVDDHGIETAVATLTNAKLTYLQDWEHRS